MDDKAILAAISAHESGDNPNAIGRSGEIGKYQFMPNTIKQLGADPKTLKGNAELQDQLALKHFATLKEQFGGDTDKAIAAWNAGSGGVRSAESQGGANWHKFLPKGTNKHGAEYDAGSYLTKIKERLGPQPQVAQAATVDEPAASPAAPSPSKPLGAEQRIAQAYRQGKKVDIEKWAEEYSWSPQAAQSAEKPAQKPQEAGGFFNSAGSAFKSAGSAVQSGAKSAADFIYPPAPVEGAGLPRKMMEGAASTMVQGGANLPGQISELLAPSPEEAKRRQGLDLKSGAAELGQKALGIASSAIDATPVGGLVAAAEPVGAAVGKAVTANEVSDEGIKARIAQLEQEQASGAPEAEASPELGGGIGGAGLPSRADQLADLKGLLMMPLDERVKQVEQAFGATAGLIAGAAPLEMFLGAGKAIGKAGKAFETAQAGGKAAGVEAVAKAGEQAMTAGAKPANAAEKLDILKQSPEATAALDQAVPAAAAAPKPSPVARIVEDVNFAGSSKRATMGPNDNMVVALDENGKDLGYLWYTREEGGGYTVRKRETVKEHQRKGVATALDDAVTAAEGPYMGSTDFTPEGKAFRNAMDKRRSPQPAEMGTYKDAQALTQGDTDLTEALLKERGYTLPDFGLRENADVQQALGMASSATGGQKAWAQQAAIGVAHDIGMVPEAAAEALPAVGKIIKGLSKSDAEALRAVVEAGVNDTNSPLSALRSSALVGAGQEGKVNAGLLFVMGRAAIGGALGAMTGDDPETSVRNALLAAGVSSLLSPKIAKTIVTNLNDPAIRDSLKKTLALHGEAGSMNLRFPSRGVGKEPSPNTANMGVGDPAKALVRGINEKLQKLDLLDRAKVQTHDMTVEAARHSQYNSVEKVLSLDGAKLSLDELPSAGLAARGLRDFVAEDVIQTAARAKLNPGDAALADEVVSKVALTGKLSQQVTNLETAYARATNALGIMTDTTMASKFDLAKFSGDLEAFRGALTGEGKVSPTQLVEMITNLADKAAAAKIASVASKWPEALWNIYYGLNLLASPLTHARNVIGNTGALGMAVLDRAGGELLGPLYRIAGKESVAPGETYHMVKAMYEIVSDSFRAGSDKMGALGYFNEARTTGKSMFGASKYTEALSVAEAAMKDGKGTLPWLVQTMSTLGAKNMGVMTGVDEFFKVLSFQGELRALAQRGSQHLTGKARSAEFMRLMDEPTTDMLHGATEFAKENTFTKAFQPGTDGGWRTVWGLGSQVESAANNPFMKVLATPFYRTPMRIGEFSTVHTPVLNLLAPQFASDMVAGGVKQQLAIAKVMTGTAMMSSMYWFAAHGYITGAPPSDPQLRKKMELAGWQEKSIYNPTNGKYYSYDNIEPISTIVGTIATFIQAAPDMDDHSIQTITSAGVLALGKNILNKQWFTGLQDLSEALQGMFSGNEDAGALMKFVARRAATLIPGASASRTVQNASDPVKRDTQTVKDNENPELREFEKLVHIFAQSTPGWGGRNALELAGYKPRPAAIHGITGEVLPNENQWLGLVNPFRVTSFKNDVVLNELVALDGAGLPQELIPRVLGGSQAGSPFKLQGDEMREMKEGVKLSEEERDRLGVLMTREITDYNGDTMHEAMKREIESEEYKDEKDGRGGGKAYRLASIYHEFLAEAADKLRDEYAGIDIAIQRRKVERDGGRQPKSMEWLQDSAREMAGQRMR